MDKRFDIVVVGGGSAGCAVAARLAEAGLGSVCLIEAGERSYSPFVHVPVGYYRTMSDHKINWGFETVPQTNLGGRKITCPRGKVLGGSSALNGLVYIRGQHQDYDEWANRGNPGWSWNHVLPYFKRSEDQSRGASHFHGVGGPLGVSDPDFQNLGCDAFIAAAQNCQIPINSDFNGAYQGGVGTYQLTTKDGLRSVTSRFLATDGSLGKVHICSGAMVDRLAFDGSRAEVVYLKRRGRIEVIRANRAIVLCAGAIGSPAILQRSGVGPKALLQELGIQPVLVKEAVGKNLQDHFQARAVFKCHDSASLNVISKRISWRLAVGLSFLFRRSGPLTIGAGFVGLFANSSSEISRPDIQFHVMPFSVDRPGRPFHDFSGFTVSVCELRPRSRGDVKIVSTLPDVSPSIDPRYFSEPEDGWAIARGIELARTITRTEPLGSLVTEEHEPGVAVADLEGLRQYAANRGSTIFHPCGTCRMGPDDEAVVDEKLKVRALDNLWIADASIMPSIISGNTNAAAIMIGERGADFIRNNLKGS